MNEPHPDVVNALKAEAHGTAGGHQPEVQRDLENLDRVTARWLLTLLRNQQSKPAFPWAQGWRPRTRSGHPS